MDKVQFDHLSARERVLVAMAVLLDGFEAGVYLALSENGQALEQVALELAGKPPEVRMPLLGTLLRRAIEEL